MSKGLTTLRVSQGVEEPAEEVKTGQRGGGRFLRWAPKAWRLGTPPLLLAQRDDPRADEQYRIIRTKLLQNPRDLSMVVVSSPGAGDGKTVTAIHLAATLALRAEERVLLVDGDLRRPGVHRYLGLTPGPGLADLLQGRDGLEACLHRLETASNLRVLPAGERAANPAELLASSRWPEVARALRQRFRHIVLDSPPAGGIADFELLSGVCDGVILVVRQDHTDRTLCAEAVRALGGQLIGVVFNAAEDWFLWKPYHSYYPYREGNET